MGSDVTEGAVGILGVGLSLIVVAIGLFWAIPNLGLFGLIWTAAAIFIAISNIRRVLGKH